jgi:hypothetical protein
MHADDAQDNHRQGRHQQRSPPATGSGSLLDWRAVDGFRSARCRGGASMRSAEAYPIKSGKATVSRPQTLPTGACPHPTSVPRNPGGVSGATRQHTIMIITAESKCEAFYSPEASTLAIAALSIGSWTAHRVTTTRPGPTAIACRTPPGHGHPAQARPGDRSRRGRCLPATRRDASSGRLSLQIPWLRSGPLVRRWPAPWVAPACRS